MPESDRYKALADLLEKFVLKQVKARNFQTSATFGGKKHLLHVRRHPAAFTPTGAGDTR